MLKEAAQRLKSSLRCYDKVGRYGGEEFLIVAPGCSQEDIVTLAERVRHCIGGEPVDTGEEMLPISCSLGAAVSATGQKEDGAALLASADAALYRAKVGGRNRTELAAEVAV